MNIRNRKWILSLSTATLLLAAGATELAWAQYGGRSTGGNFDSPRDSRAGTRSYRAPQARSAESESASNDPYDPQVWRSRSGQRRGWTDGSQSGGVQHAGGVRSNAPGAIRQASHNQPYPMMYDEGPIMEDGMIMGPGPEEEYWGGQPPGSMHGGMMHDGMMHGGGCSSCGDGGCGGSCGGGSCGGDCGDSCGRGCVQGCCMPCIFPDYFEVFGGVQGFKGPRDFGANGNFGFHEGFNSAGPMGFIPNVDLNYQIGWQAMQSNLSGTVFGDDYRRQYFLTAGLFHYQECGLNYGAVWDWQRDNYYDDIDINQIRGQVSLRSPAGREIGFYAAIGTNDDLGQGHDPGGLVPVIPPAYWEVNDQFVAFHRWNFDCGGDFRLYGGFSGSKDGIIGSDFHNPLNDSWSLHGGFTYLIPSEGNQGSGRDAMGAINEQWNITLSLVYTFGKKARNHGCGSPRPMFDVADNGSMLIHMQEEHDN